MTALEHELADFVLSARVVVLSALIGPEATLADRRQAAVIAMERAETAQTLMRHCDPADAGEQLIAAILAEIATAWALAGELLALR